MDATNPPYTTLHRVGFCGFQIPSKFENQARPELNNFNTNRQIFDGKTPTNILEMLSPQG